MAIESVYMRQRIKYHITAIRKYMMMTNVPEDKEDLYYSTVEIHIIEIATLTRKLRDLGTKIPTGVLDKIQIVVSKFASNGADSQRAYAVMEKEYDLDNPTKITLTLARIVDLIIHSYILQAVGTEDGAFSSIFFTSDTTRLDGLYKMELTEFIDACLKVCNAYPSSLHSTYDPIKQKWIHLAQ